MVGQFLTKLDIVSLWDPAIALLLTYPNELKTCSHKNLHPNVYGSFIQNCQNLESTKTSFSKSVDKQTVEYKLWNTYNRILFGNKEK